MRPIHTDASLSIVRDDQGLLHVRADDEAAVYRGLGFAHGHDRALQLVFMRILGQGRAAELLDGKLIDVDVFFRKMNWRGHVSDEADKMAPADRALADAYAEGVNVALARSVPWELKLLRHAPEPWRFEDTVLLARMTGYLTLAQSQGELERFLVELVQAGASAAHLEALFPGQLQGLDVELLRKVVLGERVVPEAVRHLAGGARMMASNNWVVSGARTRSGKPILANDPHLEINRLPAVWYELVVQTPDRSAVAATIPGLAGLLVARTDELAWGATYSFADATDSWIEDVRDDRVRRGDAWVPLTKRIERIAVKGRAPVEVVFRETAEHGVVDDPLDPEHPKDGLRLATRWSAARAGARSLTAIFALWRARTVSEGMRHLGALELSFNWVLADGAGHIGYQMSGALPVRREGHSGLVPMPGWDAANDWRGLHDVAVLPRVFDPAVGYVVTANDDLNHFGETKPINAPMGSYRAERIAALLEELSHGARKLDVADMVRIQMDVRSRQAEAFVAFLRPCLPDTADGKAIAEWDFGYGAESLGAEAFERFYAALVRVVFGPTMGDAVIAHLEGETGLFIDFYASFDRVLLAETSPWHAGRSRDALFREAAARALRGTPKPWGAVRGIVQKHVLFGDMPWARALGFNIGPFPLVGGRATPHQGQIYRSGNRLTTFAPSLRIVTDLAEEGWHSCLAGGPSDRRFSRWYRTDVAAWRAGRMKRVRPGPRT